MIADPKINFYIDTSTQLEKYALELLYYNYELPILYINNCNRLFGNNYMYFHSGTNSNEKIINMLMTITNNERLLFSILTGLAFSGNIKLLIKYFNSDDTNTTIDKLIDRYATYGGYLSHIKMVILNKVLCI